MKNPPPAKPLSKTFRVAVSVCAVSLALATGCPATRAQTPAPTVAIAEPAMPYRRAATWRPGGEGGWDYLTCDAAARRLYVVRDNRVQVLDTATGQLIGEVPGVDGAHGVALAPELRRGFATAGRGGSVVVFDTETLRPVGAPIPVGKKPDAIVFEPATRRVFVFNGESQDATVLDAATAGVVGTIPLGGKPEFAACDERGRVFVNIEDTNETLALDARSLQILHRWPLAPGETPTGLSMDAARRRLFVGCHNEKMVVLDAADGAVLATLPIGKGVDATAFDPETGRAFSSNGEGTLTVIGSDGAGPSAGSTFRVLASVPTQRGARTLALDPKTHAVFLAAADYAPAPAPTAEQPRPRPAVVPGSFVILKYEPAAP